MRQARFETVFCGIETPEPDALKAMAKEHNMMVPLLEGVRRMILRGLRVLSAVLWQCGVRADYRRLFWKVARDCLNNGRIDSMIRVGLMSHHLIMSARDAVAGRQRASHYSARPREIPVPAE
jgi:Domain of unknown function (DUF4070)